MIVLLILFCAVSVSSICILCYIDILYYYAPDKIIYGALLFLVVVVGIYSFFRSYFYLLNALLSGALLGGVFLSLRLAAIFFEDGLKRRGFDKGEIDSTSLGKRIFVLGLGDVKYSMLVGFIVGFLTLWKNDVESYPAASQWDSYVYGICVSAYVLTFLTFINAVVFWVVIPWCGRYCLRILEQTTNRKRATRQSLPHAGRTHYTRLWDHKIPLIPCMTMAMVLTFIGSRGYF